MVQIGHGTVLTGGTSGIIGEITNISGPNESVDSVDVTSFDSANTSQDFIPGLIDGGEITFTVIYDGTAAGTADALQTAFLGPEEEWEIVYPDGSSDTADGSVTALGKQIPNGDKITQDVTIKFTGKVTPVYN